ncbi:hypothetical protein UlMin_015522 [Ulmus minor]
MPPCLQPTIKIWVDGLKSSSVAVKRSAMAKLRLLVKNQSDNRALIGESNAIPAMIPLLQCSDPWTQEHTVIALLNLSLHEGNKALITNTRAIKSLVYVLKIGTETSKQKAACALLTLALVEENKSSIGACGAIPGTISAGVVKPLVVLVAKQGIGLAEKAMFVLSNLADGSVKGKEFAVLTLWQLCADCVRNRGLLIREGRIPPLVALSQTVDFSMIFSRRRKGFLKKKESQSII